MTGPQTDPRTRADAPVLLATKLHPPVVPAQIVARERLFARLREGRGRRLSLVACPAGFGKSTLLAAWREADAGGPPMAWVTLDEGDNDVVVLWSHVLQALGQACPGFDAASLQAMVPVAPLVEVVLPRLVNELVEHGEAALILDDFHRLANGPARESLDWFVERLPVFLPTRAREPHGPGVALGTLRARGELLELRADELRFTRRGGYRVPQRTARTRSGPGDLELLVARTEGWPAGLYLAALSLEGKPDKHSLVVAFDGTSTHVVDYLADDVLGGYDEELQAFMLRTSVLERFCPDLCDAVLGYSDATAALDALARSNLFLIPLDGHRQWFRFHHLFAQILRVELERREPEPGARAASARVRLASRIGHDRGGDLPRACGAGVRRRRPADARDVGVLRQCRTDRDGARLGPCLPGRRARARPPGPRSEGVGLRAAGAHGRDVASRRPATRARRSRRGAAARWPGLAGVQPVAADGDLQRDRERRCRTRQRFTRRRASRVPVRRGTRSPHGRWAGRTTATTSSTGPSGASRRPSGSARPPSSGSSPPHRSRSCR